MTETERLALLLCEAAGVDPDEPSVIWASKRQGYLTNLECQSRRAEQLTAAGLTIVPREPDEATVDEMARAAAHALFDELGPVWAATNERELFVQDAAPTLRAQVRAAYRAGVGRKDQGA